MSQNHDFHVNLSLRKGFLKYCIWSAFLWFPPTYTLTCTPTFTRLNNACPLVFIMPLCMSISYAPLRERITASKTAGAQPAVPTENGAAPPEPPSSPSGLSEATFFKITDEISLTPDQLEKVTNVTEWSVPLVLPIRNDNVLLNLNVL